VTESYVAAVLRESSDVDPALREQIAAGRRALMENGVPIESFRPVPLDEALERL